MVKWTISQSSFIQSISGFYLTVHLKEVGLNHRQVVLYISCLVVVNEGSSFIVVI